ncbi:hypothetical protein NMG60_11017578 [Bertholletia excelsa]
MGSTESKEGESSVEKLRVEFVYLSEKVRVLEKELGDMTWMRESENEAYEREMMVYALREGEWRRERKRMREELRKLKKILQQRNQVGTAAEKEKISSNQLVEQMVREERVLRDDAVERWKRLYLAIKIDLDALIQRTHQERIEGRREEELTKELKAREETIQKLEERIASMEREESKRVREVDILRQSLRILDHKNYPSISATSYLANTIKRSLDFFHK